MPTLILQHQTVSLLPRDFDSVEDAEALAAAQARCGHCFSAASQMVAPAARAPEPRHPNARDNKCAA